MFCVFVDPGVFFEELERYGFSGPLSLSEVLEDVFVVEEETLSCKVRECVDEVPELLSWEIYLADQGAVAEYFAQD